MVTDKSVVGVTSEEEVPGSAGVGAWVDGGVNKIERFCVRDDEIEVEVGVQIETDQGKESGD